jgi:hypothetical protein
MLLFKFVFSRFEVKPAAEAQSHTDCHALKRNYYWVSYDGGERDLPKLLVNLCISPCELVHANLVLQEHNVAAHCHDG